MALFIQPAGTLPGLLLPCATLEMFICGESVRAQCPPGPSTALYPPESRELAERVFALLKGAFKEFDRGVIEMEQVVRVAKAQLAAEGKAREALAAQAALQGAISDVLAGVATVDAGAAEAATAVTVQEPGPEGEGGQG